MTSRISSVENENQNQVIKNTGLLNAATGLALVRFTIGVMFLWVFFENLGKGLYRPAGYAGLINYYIQHDRAPSFWKTIMAMAASHASIAAPLQGMKERHQHPGPGGTDRMPQGDAAAVDI